MSIFLRSKSYSFQLLTCYQRSHRKPNIITCLSLYCKSIGPNALGPIDLQYTQNHELPQNKTLNFETTIYSLTNRCNSLVGKFRRFYGGGFQTFTILYYIA